MTLAEMKSRVIFQYNADEDDLGDYEPHIDGYLNTGYDKLLYALLHFRLGDEGFPKLEEAEDEPVVPDWMHAPITDYATWLIYRNGNPQKQQRGLRYLEAFNEALAECKSLAGKASYNAETGEITFSMDAPQFYNVYP